MIRLSKATTLAIRDLAVAYSEYLRNATDLDKKGRDNGIVVWGDMLLEKQKFLGVEIIPAADLQESIERARNSDYRWEAA